MLPIIFLEMDVALLGLREPNSPLRVPSHMLESAKELADFLDHERLLLRALFKAGIYTIEELIKKTKSGELAIVRRVGPEYAVFIITRLLEHRKITSLKDINLSIYLNSYPKEKFRLEA